LIGTIADSQLIRIDKGTVVDPTGALRNPPVLPTRAEIA
jgi:hypothetical protein